MVCFFEAQSSMLLMKPPHFRRLPPLSALCAIEAVARLGSVTRAANELSLTQSAVSHNIRLAEEALGIVLFRRDTTGTVVLPRGALEGLGEQLKGGQSQSSSGTPAA